MGQRASLSLSVLVLLSASDPLACVLSADDSADCPQELPTEGNACDVLTIQCLYAAHGTGCETVVYTCPSGVWQFHTDPTCQMSSVATNASSGASAASSSAANGSGGSNDWGWLSSSGAL